MVPPIVGLTLGSLAAAIWGAIDRAKGNEPENRAYLPAIAVVAAGAISAHFMEKRVKN
jgi:hypothetical protein